MAVYEITSFRGGLSDDEDKGIRGAFKFASNIDIRKRKDTLTTTQAYSEVTDITFEDIIRFWVKASDGNLYGFGNTGWVYKRDSDGNWSKPYKAPSTIKGASEWFTSTGLTYMYFALDTALYRKELPGDSDWSDVNATGGYPKTNLTSADWHTMREAGGALVICNGSTLAMVGYDDSYTNEALDLLPGNIAKTIVERNGRSIIGSFRAEAPTRGVNAAIDAELPLAQVGEDGEIFFADMTDSMPITAFPGGGVVNPGGVTNEVEQANLFEWEQDALNFIDKQTVGNMALFGVYNADEGKGGVYSYGRKKKNHPFVLNLEYLFDVTEIGALVHVDSINLLSYRDGDTFGVKMLDLNNKAQGVYEGLDFKAPVKKPLEITTWDQAEFLMAPLPAGASVEFWYKKDKYGDFIQARLGNGQASFDVEGGKKAVFNIGIDGDIFEPRLVLNPAGNLSPEIHRVHIHFH